jgi:hypothetical protein
LCENSGPIEIISHRITATPTNAFAIDLFSSS